MVGVGEVEVLEALGGVALIVPLDLRSNGLFRFRPTPQGVLHPDRGTLGSVRAGRHHCAEQEGIQRPKYLHICWRC